MNPIWTGIQRALTCTPAVVADRSQHAQMSHVETQSRARFCSLGPHSWKPTFIEVTDIQYKACLRLVISLTCHLQDETCHYKLERHVAPMEFSLSELCYITAAKWTESQHKKLEACLCLRKQNIWTGCVPTLKSEEAESDHLKQRWVVLSDLKLWVNCGCVYMLDNIRVWLRAMLNWESEHVWPLKVSETTDIIETVK